MKTLSRPRRRHVAGMTPFRLLGWLTAAAMVALATLGPAAGTSLAAKPDAPGQNGNGPNGGGQNGNDQNGGGGAGDNACNNVLSGGRSPDYVWVTADAAGVTVWWSQTPDRFGTTGEMVVRACVVVDDAELGAIVQNTANDGSEVFGWSAFGLAADPCVAGPAQVAGSVDGGASAIGTKKSDVITCSPPANDEETSLPAGDDQPGVEDEQSGDQQTPPGDEQSGEQPGDQQTPPGDEQSGEDDQSGEQSGDEQAPPPAGNEERANQPVTEVQPSTEFNPPTQQPVVEPPAAPTESPAGAVLGAVGEPSITPPPTDTLGTVPATSSDGWRFILLGLAAFLAALLLAMPDDRTARRRA